MIDLLGLAQGHTLLSMRLDDAFFEAEDQTEILGGDVSVGLDIERCGEVFIVKSSAEGRVAVVCDLCLDAMEQPVASETTFSVRLGDEDDYSDDVVIVSRERAQIDMRWLLTEQIILALPIKHVHAPGKCNAAMTEKLMELSHKGTLALSLEEMKSIQGYFRQNRHYFYDLEDIFAKSGVSDADMAGLRNALSDCIMYKAATPFFINSFEETAWAPPMFSINRSRCGI